MNINYKNRVFSREEKLLGIEVADKVIRYVYLEKSGYRYHVKKEGKFQTDIDETSPDSLTRAISRLLEREMIEPTRIFLTISSKNTVIHQVVLPQMTRKEMEEVITSEIEKIPVFYNTPYESVYKGYYFNEESKKIIFAAIPHSTINFYLNEVQKLEIDFKDVDIAPLNIKNILPALMPKKDFYKKEEEKCKAILIVHDQCAFVSVVEGERYKLIYKSPIGTDTLSRGDINDPKNKLVSNWTSELNLVLKSYLSENKGDVIDDLYLIWDKDKVEGLDERIGSDLGQKNVKVLDLKGTNQLIFKDGHSFNPIYVLAITPILHYIHRLKADFPLNHFFKNFQIQEYLKKMLKNAAVTSLVVMVFLSLATLILVNKTNNLKKETKVMSQEYKNLKSESKVLFDLQEDYINARQKLLSQATYVRQLNRISWAQVLTVVAKELPKELALSSFEFSESGKAKIKGETYDMESIAELIRRIDESVILEKAKFSYLREKQLEGQKIFNFGIFANLQNIKDETIE